MFGNRSGNDESEATILLSMEHSSSERYDGLMNASNGDLVFTEEPTIWDVKLDKTEIIPMTPINIFHCSILANHDDTKKIYDNVVKEKFIKHWRNGLITNKGTSKNMLDAKNNGSLWQTQNGNSEDVNFNQTLFLYYPETQHHIFKFFSACSTWDSPSDRGNYDIESSPKYQKRESIKNHIFKGKTDCINPIFQYKLPSDISEWKKTTKNKIWRGGKITCYFVEVSYKVGDEDKKVVVQEFLCEEKYGASYLNSGDIRYKYYQPIGTVETYDGGYCYDYIFDILKLENKTDGLKWKTTYENFLKKTRTIKINIFSS
jgi:hypothetical protein